MVIAETSPMLICLLFTSVAFRNYKTSMIIPFISLPESSILFWLNVFFLGAVPKFNRYKSRLQSIMVL